MRSDDRELKRALEQLLEGSFVAKYSFRDRPDAVPLLIDALNDPRVRPTRKMSDPKLLSEICELIRPHAPAQATETLVRCLAPATGSARSAICATLVAIGTPDAISSLTNKLATLGKRALDQVLLQLWPALRRLDRPHASAAVAPLFDLLTPRLESAKESDYKQLAEILLYLDPTRATEILTRKTLFQPTNPKFVTILHALDDCRIPIPADSLVPLIPQLKANIKPDDQADRASRAFEFALPVIARSAPEVARPIITEYLSSESLMLQRGARNALAVLAGVEDAYGVVVRKLRGTDRGYHFETLSVPQKTYWIAYQVDEQVCSNGFSGYFSNPSGRHASEAPAALEAIGAPKSAHLMRRALGTEPSVGHESERPLDSQYYDLKDEDILGLLKVYAAHHAAHFR